MHFHANPRMTRDIDIVIELTSVNATKLCRTLGPGYYCDDQMVLRAIQDTSMFNVISQEAGIKVDFVIKKQTEYAVVAFSRKKEMELLGRKVWVSTAEDLVVSKLDWARDSESEMQLRDVSNLLRVKGIDISYIEKWVKSLKLETLYAKAKSY